MAYQLNMEKSLSIKALRDTSLSERAIAESLGVSRNAVRRHLASNPPNDTKAPTGKAPTGAEGSDDTKAPTGSGESWEGVVSSVSRSRCERFRDVIVSKLEQGLDAQQEWVRDTDCFQRKTSSDCVKLGVGALSLFIEA